MRITFALASLFLLQGVFAQKTDSIFRRNERNIYFQAIEQYIQHRKEENKKTDTLFLEANFNITDSILSECRNTKLIKLDNVQVKDLMRKGVFFNLYRIMPIRTTEENLSVTLIPFSCGYNKDKKRYNLFYGGRYTAVFEFDRGQLVFQNIETHGI